jgi:hypothetical protein
MGEGKVDGLSGLIHINASFITVRNGVFVFEIGAA